MSKNNELEIDQNRFVWSMSSLWCKLTASYCDVTLLRYGEVSLCVIGDTGDTLMFHMGENSSILVVTLVCILVLVQQS